MVRRLVEDEKLVLQHEFAEDEPGRFAPERALVGLSASSPLKSIWPLVRAALADWRWDRIARASRWRLPLVIESP